MNFDGSWDLIDEDDELIARAQDGDNAAFGELMRRTAAASLRQAKAILRSHHLAEEEVQNAYLSAWRHIGQFHGDAKFSTWINRIVTNQCLMRLRSLRTDQRISLNSATAAEGVTRARDVMDLGATPEDHCCRQQEADVLGKQIGMLPSRLRSVLLLRDLKEMSTLEAATDLGISKAAVKSRLLRARLELRRRLEKLIRLPVPAGAMAAE